MPSKSWLTDLDLYLIGEGTHRRAYEKLGAHPDTERGRSGVRFAVWAPNAEAVSLIGEWNGWQPGVTFLNSMGDSGIWEKFVEGIGPGALYKYAIRPRHSSTWIEKADPYAFGAELRPKTASVVVDLDSYIWGDGDWVAHRTEANAPGGPISVYEVHLGSWKRDPAKPERLLTYRELADQLPPYAAEMGYTHVELLPIAEYPYDPSWGYQVTSYFAPTSRFGGPTDLMYLIDRCHAAGLGVILDWVPAHFPKDPHGLARFDSTSLYEHADPRRGEHPDWGTLIFNYGRHEVQTFLISNAVFWLDRYHVDGLRVDAVASMLYLDYSRRAGEWLPNQYGGRENLEAIDLLRAANRAVHEEYAGTLTIAEESTAWPGVTRSVEDGGLGFDLKWNMGWMHDTLVYFAKDPIYRRYHQNDITFSLVYAFSERYVLPLSHDEVVHGKGSLLAKMPADDWQKFANLRLLFGYMYGHPGKKLLFMGSDLGQWREWSYSESLDWHVLDLPGEEGVRHRGIRQLVHDLNDLYRRYPVLHASDFDSAGFFWIDIADADNSVVSFVRRAGEANPPLVFVCNFTPGVHDAYRVGLPAAGRYRTVLNTDDLRYGGSGAVQQDPVDTDAIPMHGQPVSAQLKLPPLGVCILTPD